MIPPLGPDGKTALLARQKSPTETELILWDAVAGREQGWLLVSPGNLSGAGFGANVQTVWARDFLDGTNRVRTWNAVSGKPLGSPMPSAVGIHNQAFARDGRSFLVASNWSAIQVWDLATGKPLGGPLGGDQRLGCAAFHPDGAVVATGGDDGTLSLWRVPPPVQGSAAHLRCWMELLTGQELDADGTPQILGTTAWQERSQRLRDLGGHPLP
jgi:WD40 repeat protein